MFCKELTNLPLEEKHNNCVFLLVANLSTLQNFSCVLSPCNKFWHASAVHLFHENIVQLSI